MSAEATANLQPGKFIQSARLKTIYSIFMFLGFLTFVVGINIATERAWAAYLTSFFFFVSLALGGLFFTALQYVTKAGWSVNIRRFSEALVSFLPIGLIFALILLFGASHLYDWFDPQKVMADELLHKKTSYLNKGFFVVRLLAFFSVWFVFSKIIIGRSLKQDDSGDENITLKLVPWSIGFILFFAISYSLFSVDTLMSLDAHWFSTMFGVYCFAGLFQSSLAAIILVTLWVRGKGLVNGFVKPDHLHDLGKFLKGFTVFMAYIGFCQFMLIWYANMPEETEFFIHRSHGGWMAISLSLLVGKFIVPFIYLLPKHRKRSPFHLTVASVLILVMQYVDIYWLVYPNIGSHINFGIWEIGIFIGFLGVFIKSVAGFLGGNSLIPMKDPRRYESMAHHVSY